MLRHKKSLALFLVLVFLAAGCLTTGQKTTSPSAKELAWKTLTTGKQTYDATFTMLGQLDRQGKLSAQAKAKAIQLGTVYMAAHNEAVDQLLADKTPSMVAVNAALKGFLEYAATVKGAK